MVQEIEGTCRHTLICFLFFDVNSIIQELFAHVFLRQTARSSLIEEVLLRTVLLV